MDNLNTIGEQESQEVTNLQQTKDMLLAEIKQGEELLSESKIIKGQAESLRKELKTLKEEHKEIVKKIKVSKNELNDISKTKLESKQLMDNSIIELESKRNNLQAEIDNQIISLKENEERFNANSIEFAKKLSDEKKLKEAEVKEELKIVCNKLEEIERKLNGATERNIIIENDNKLLEDKNNNLEREIKNKEDSIDILTKNTAEFAVFDEDLVRANVAAGEANKTLNQLKKDVLRERENLEIIKKDQEASRGWMTEKENRIKKIGIALAKKTSDPSIIRMLDNI